MIIKAVEAGGLGSALGLKPGDRVETINGDPVRDVIDYQFNITDPYIDLTLQRDGVSLDFSIEKEYHEDLGVVFEEIQYRDCASKCPFCFVDQNPEGMRKALYFRDEDFRLSFMHGSYFTLNNVSRSDLQRMVDQRLSPLYISVHALDPEIRKFLFGVDRNDRLHEKITFLTENGIELHTQVVLCPGINDGDILLDTLQGLEKYFPGVRTVAVVPLGLTKYRDGLYQFRTVTKTYARKFNAWVHKLQKSYLEKYNERYVFLSDEWYLKAEQRLPSMKHYGELFQLENGVGLTRQFINSIKSQANVFSDPMKAKKRLTLLTGVLAEPVIKEYLEPILKKSKGLSVSVKGVENSFYGSSINVSGLLTGRDFVNYMNNLESDLFLLPPNILNPDGLTLDNMTLDTIMQKTGKKVLRFSGDLMEVRAAIEAA